MNKFKRDYLPVIVAVLAAFVVSTIWFSPLLFGKPWVTLRSQWMHMLTRRLALTPRLNYVPDRLSRQRG